MTHNAFDAHLLALGQRVTSLLMQRGISQQDAEDAVSAAYEQVYGTLSTLTPANLDGWFYRVALNRYLDHYRKHRRLVFSEPPAAATQPRERFDSLIDGLNARDREVVALKYYYGFTYREIATMLGANPASIQKRLARARAKLRQQWED